MALESVQVLDAGTGSGLFGYSAGAGTLPPAGASYVNATVEVNGLDPDTDLPAEDPISKLVVVADGRTIDHVSRGVSFESNGHARVTAQFPVPVNARSVVLRVSPSVAETKHVDFRLW